ncbi:hypothetical protein D3C80_1769960 [compost metagenome]
MTVIRLYSCISGSSDNFRLLLDVWPGLNGGRDVNRLDNFRIGSRGVQRLQGRLFRLDTHVIRINVVNIRLAPFVFGSGSIIINPMRLLRRDNGLMIRCVFTGRFFFYRFLVARRVSVKSLIGSRLVISRLR